MVLFTVPLAWSMAEVYGRGAVVRLQRDAMWAAVNVGARRAAAPNDLAGLAELSNGVAVGLYTPTGSKMAGEGPATSPVTALARDGGLHQEIESGHLAVVAPVMRGGQVVEAVRVWMPWDEVTDRRLRAWLVLVGLGALVLALAAVLAWHLARRVAVPLENLTELALWSWGWKRRNMPTTKFA